MSHFPTRPSPSIKYTKLTLPDASGSIINDFRLLQDRSGSRVLDTGLSNTGAWFQSRDKNDYTVNYPLLLNPNGGTVIIGDASISTLSIINGINANIGGGPAGTAGAPFYFTTGNSSDSTTVEFRQGRFNKDVVVASSNQTLSANFFHAIENGTSVFTVGTGGTLTVGGASSTGNVELSGSGNIRGIILPGVGGDSIFNAIYGVSNGYQILTAVDNAITYIWHNGSGSQVLKLDNAGNLGLNVTPGPWGDAKAIQLGLSGNVYGDGQVHNWVSGLSLNAYRSGNNWLNYSATSPTGRFEIGNGGSGSVSGFGWYYGAGGAAGTPAAFNQLMSLDPTGHLNVLLKGTTSTALPGVSIIRITDGTPAAGFAGSLQYTLMDAGTNLINTNSIRSEWVDASPGARTAKLVFTAASGNLQTDSLTLDQNGNIGIATIPDAWVGKALQISNYAAFAQRTGTADLILSWNAVVASGASSGEGYVVRVGGDRVSAYEQNGAHRWYVGPAGSTGSAVVFAHQMTYDIDGNFIVGQSSVYGAVGGGLSRGTFTYGHNSRTHLAVSNQNAGASASAAVVLGSYGGDWSFENGSTAKNTNTLTFNYNNVEKFRVEINGNLYLGTASAIGGTNAAKVTFYNNAATQTGFQTVVGPDHTGVYAIGAFSTVQAASGTDVALVVQSGNGASVSANQMFVYTNGDIKNTNNVYGAISDAKLKENITDTSPKLAKLNQIRIVNYTLKSDPTHTPQLGVLAHELELIFPGLITETPDIAVVNKKRTIRVPAVPSTFDSETNKWLPETPSYTTVESYTEYVLTSETTKSVKYSVFVPMLIKGVQEQQVMIDSNSERVAELESKIEGLTKIINILTLNNTGQVFKVDLDAEVKKDTPVFLPKLTGSDES